MLKSVRLILATTTTKEVVTWVLYVHFTVTLHFQFQVFSKFYCCVFHPHHIWECYYCCCCCCTIDDPMNFLQLVTKKKAFTIFIHTHMRDI